MCKIVAKRAPPQPRGLVAALAVLMLAFASTATATAFCAPTAATGVLSYEVRHGTLLWSWAQPSLP